MAAVAASLVVVLLSLVSLDLSAGELIRRDDLPRCDMTAGLALDENREIVCAPYCGSEGSDDGRLCLNMGGPPPVHTEGQEDHAEKARVQVSNMAVAASVLGIHPRSEQHVNINDIGRYAVHDQRYVMEKPLENDIRKCNDSGGDVRACVAREIACHARDLSHCIIWRRAAYIFCSKSFCGRKFFEDCLLSHVLDDGNIVHTNESHVSTGGWESFREHSVHYENSNDLALDLKKLDTGNETICRTDPAPTIPHCEWSMMLQLKTCPEDQEDEDDHGDH